MQNRYNHSDHSDLPGLYIVERLPHEDERGFFLEIYRKSDLEGLDTNFENVQVNIGFSKPKVIRALHVENWDKYVYTDDLVFSAIVDVRPGSPT